MMEDFMPHGYCFRYAEEILWPMVTGDALTALSYFSMPFALGWFAWKRPDMPFRIMFILAALFILSCAIGHALDIYNIWNGAYMLAAYQRLVTGCISLVVAVVLWPTVKAAIKMPSPDQMKEKNRALAREAEQKEIYKAENQRLKARIRQLEK